ncbi:hypothetical protein B0T21DRAFT_75240 [Apiosordaria backusii]|uniref:Uncharacterized protein n=1 Tax=Apiosordaria backusii TaxID=314023 RepID=A0AA40AAJ1_9PEZI|nr:hypothetical protein B0T21DRAFT_75240 [Apiosordaria backusii]
MDALKNLAGNVPEWLHKLDELNGQIKQRQNELAQLAEKDKEKSPTSAPKSIRNKGSTESLRPRDEPEAHPREATPQPQLETHGDATRDAAVAKTGTDQPPSSPSDSHSPSAIQRQENKVRAAGQARARATLGKRQRTDSVISANGGPPKYRSRTMIIVYYDSYVQIFFEELVKFVSTSRNMMRKAKMAAKVAQIKRLAELETPEDDDEDEKKDGAPASGNGTIEAAPASPNGDEEEIIPALQYVSTRRLMGGGPSAMMARAAMGGRGYARAGARGSVTLGFDGKPLQSDVYDELDKGLEFVQSMCEHAAHQFLRDGDCGEEITKIQQRLRETKELADKEMERVEKENPTGLQKDAEETKGRSYRPQSMRREHLNALKAAETNGLGSEMKLEVDDGAADDVEMVLPPRRYIS